MTATQKPGKISATIEKTDKVKIILNGDNSEKSKECLEELAASANKLSKTHEVDRVVCTKKSKEIGYSIKIIIDPDQGTLDLLENLKNSVTGSEMFLQFYKTIQKITQQDKYLGRWQRGTSFFRSRVNSDMEEICACLEERLGVKYEHMCLRKKSGNIAAARSITSLILRTRYRNGNGEDNDNKINRNEGKLSSIEIGEILGGRNHATVIVSLKRFKNTNPKLYEREIPKAVSNGIKYYQGRINKNYGKPNLPQNYGKSKQSRISKIIQDKPTSYVPDAVAAVVSQHPAPKTPQLATR